MRSRCASSASASCLTTGMHARLRFVFGSFATPPQTDLPGLSFSASFLVPQTERLTLNSSPLKLSHVRPRRALRQLRLGAMAAVLETRLQQAQAEPMAPIDFLSCLVSDELTRRGDRLLERRRKQAQFRDPQVSFDNFDFDFNKT